MTTRSLTRDAFVALAAEERPAVVRLAVELDANIDPLAAHAELAEGDYSFLLESAEKVASSDPAGAFSPDTDDRHARYSFVGYDPDGVVTISPNEATTEGFDGALASLSPPGEGDVLDTLRETLPDLPLRGFEAAGRQHLQGGLVGFISYDAVYDLWLDEVGVERPACPLPDAQFVLSTKTVVFDHAEESISLVFTPVVTPDTDAGDLYDDLVAEAARVESRLQAADAVSLGRFTREDEHADPRDEYEAAVDRAKEHVLDGDIYQGVISRKRELTGDVDPKALYAALREVNPSPYMYLLRAGDLSVVGASPETLVSVSGDTVVSNPIAGTCGRGGSPGEDRRLAGEMLADDKERAEHTMLVDLARNDVRRVAEPGSVRVEEFMNVLKYSHVQHIESTVTGRLAPEYDAFDATRASFPAGTLSGAPKVRAMELIHDLEAGPRGLYGGGVGYYSWTGDADFAIVIRTATIDHGETDRVTIQAGAGIVADSDPASEYEETEKKMGGVLAAIERLELPEVTP
ncbi:anthranilate synthase component I [Haladaptatus sp. DYSN1]|uniref:anthranilate synthase component I n=1 Tax=unclassified Haladaptatus TaxID=2622732 RepID=UPI002405C1FC|nr:anthranilate synthase component I [Haladaptatus sp. DYSN1]